MAEENIDGIINNKWRHPVLCGYCHNLQNCLHGTFCPCSAVATAKSSFDGSDWMFNFLCFGCYPHQVRNFIRSGYQIDGRVGTSDFLITSICYPCVATQLLNEVDSRGPKLETFRGIPQWNRLTFPYFTLHLCLILFRYNDKSMASTAIGIYNTGRSL